VPAGGAPASRESLAAAAAEPCVASSISVVLGRPATSTASRSSCWVRRTTITTSGREPMSSRRKRSTQRRHIPCGVSSLSTGKDTPIKSPHQAHARNTSPSPYRSGKQAPEGPPRWRTQLPCREREGNRAGPPLTATGWRDPARAGGRPGSPALATERPNWRYGGDTSGAPRSLRNERAWKTSRQGWKELAAVLAYPREGSKGLWKTEYCVHRQS
jgi:hypothetical protein